MERTKREAAADLGRFAELQFQLDALRHGLKVYAPVQSYPDVDCIVSRGERTWRVQVKARKAAPNNGVMTYNFQKGSHGANYNALEFDVLAAFCVDRSVWAMLHAAELHGRGNAWMPVERTRENAGALPWTDWTIFMRAGSHQPAHQLTRPILQPSPEL